MWFNQKSSYFLDTFGKQSRYLSKLRSGNTAPVPKLLGFFQWNYTSKLVLLRVFFGGGRGEMVAGNQSKIGGGDGGKDLVWIVAIKIVAGI